MLESHLVEQMYNAVFYLYKNGYRYRVNKTYEKRLDIPKQAMIYRIADELAGYTIHKDGKLVGEWWDRKARKNYSMNKDGGKGEL